LESQIKINDAAKERRKFLEKHRRAQIMDEDEAWAKDMEKKRDDAEEEDDFFAALDGEKFNLRLPEEAENYRQIKEKCEAAGYEPGSGVPADVQTNPNNPHRILAQALMKRAIADIPLVQHIQKESPAMNKLYSKSMCSVKQWRNYQAAEAMVSAEVDEVRAEADELEPGWSDLIWRQAMQYHGMLKARHEQEQAALNRAKEEAMKKKAEAMKKKKGGRRCKGEGGSCRESSTGASQSRGT